MLSTGPLHELACFEGKRSCSEESPQQVWITAFLEGTSACFAGWMQRTPNISACFRRSSECFFGVLVEKVSTTKFRCGSPGKETSQIEE